jgi:hypothetical protein
MKTIDDLPEVTSLQGTDKLYAARGTGADRDKQILVANTGLIPETATASGTQSIDLGSYSSDITFACTGTITLTFSNQLNAGRYLTLVNTDSGIITCAGVFRATLWPGDRLEAISDGSNMLVTSGNFLDVSEECKTEFDTGSGDLDLSQYNSNCYIKPDDSWPYLRGGFANALPQGRRLIITCGADDDASFASDNTIFGGMHINEHITSKYNLSFSLQNGGLLELVSTGTCMQVARFYRTYAAAYIGDVI